MRVRVSTWLFYWVFVFLSFRGVFVRFNFYLLWPTLPLMMLSLENLQFGVPNHSLHHETSHEIDGKSLPSLEERKLSSTQTRCSVWKFTLISSVAVRLHLPFLSHEKPHVIFPVGFVLDLSPISLKYFEIQRF